MKILIFLLLFAEVNSIAAENCQKPTNTQLEKVKIKSDDEFSWPTSYLDEKNEFIKKRYQKTYGVLSKQIFDLIKDIAAKPSFLKKEKNDNLFVIPIYGSQLISGDFSSLVGIQSRENICKIELKESADIDDYGNTFIITMKESAPNILYVNEKQKSSPLKIQYLTYDDSSCGFTRYWVGVRHVESNKPHQLNGTGFLIVSKVLDKFKNAEVTKLKLPKLPKKNDLRDLKGWSIDLDGDHNKDLLILYDVKEGSAIFGYYFVLYNLDGRWRFMELSDATDWETGC